MAPENRGLQPLRNLREFLGWMHHMPLSKINSPTTEKFQACKDRAGNINAARICRSKKTGRLGGRASLWGAAVLQMLPPVARRVPFRRSPSSTVMEPGVPGKVAGMGVL